MEKIIEQQLAVHGYSITLDSTNKSHLLFLEIVKQLCHYEAQVLHPHCPHDNCKMIVAVEINSTCVYFAYCVFVSAVAMIFSDDDGDDDTEGDQDQDQDTALPPWLNWTEAVTSWKDAPDFIWNVAMCINEVTTVYGIFPSLRDNIWLMILGDPAYTSTISVSNMQLTTLSTLCKLFPMLTLYRQTLCAAVCDSSSLTPCLFQSVLVRCLYDSFVTKHTLDVCESLRHKFSLDMCGVMVYDTLKLVCDVPGSAATQFDCVVDKAANAAFLTVMRGVFAKYVVLNKHLMSTDTSTPATAAFHPCKKLVASNIDVNMLYTLAFDMEDAALMKGIVSLIELTKEIMLGQNAETAEVSDAEVKKALNASHILVPFSTVDIEDVLEYISAPLDAGARGAVVPASNSRAAYVWTFIQKAASWTKQFRCHVVLDNVCFCLLPKQFVTSMHNGGALFALVTAQPAPDAVVVLPVYPALMRMFMSKCVVQMQWVTSIVYYWATLDVEKALDVQQYVTERTVAVCNRSIPKMMQTFLANRGNCDVFFVLQNADYLRKLMLVFLNFVLFEADTFVRVDVHRTEMSVDDFQRKTVWKLYKNVHGGEMAKVRANVDWIFQPSGKGFEFYPMLYRLVSNGIRGRCISVPDALDLLSRYSVLHTKNMPFNHRESQPRPDETVSAIVMESASLVTVAVEDPKEGMDGIGVLPTDHDSMRVMLHMFALFNLATMSISSSTAAMHYADVVSTVDSAGDRADFQHMKCPVAYNTTPLSTQSGRDGFVYVMYDHELFFVPHLPKTKARAELLGCVNPVVLGAPLDRPLGSTDGIFGTKTQSNLIHQFYMETELKQLMLTYEKQ